MFEINLYGHKVNIIENKLVYDVDSIDFSNYNYLPNAISGFHYDFECLQEIGGHFAYVGRSELKKGEFEDLLKTENVEYTSVYRVDLGSLDYDFVLPNENLKKILYYLDDDAIKHFDIYKYKLPDTGDFMTSSELILNTVLA